MIWKCRHCQAPFDTEPLELFGRNILPTICNPCDDIHIAQEANQRAAAVMQGRRDTFERLCPPEYRKPILETLLADVASHKKVLAWRFNSIGMVVSGPPRAAKTRSVWALLQRLIVEEGRTVAAFTAGEFATACKRLSTVGEAYGTSAEDADELFAQMTGRDLLFIDDFGKFKVTERMEDAVHRVIEHCTGHATPILMTTNGNRDQLSEAFSSDRREPIFERLREFCRGVNFDAKAAKP